MVQSFLYCIIYPQFSRLYQRGPPEKIEKLKCILHYFKRITEKSILMSILSRTLFRHFFNLVPTGVITFRRVALLYKDYPKWSNSRANLCDIHLTTSKKIEDVNYVLQVNRMICFIYLRTFSFVG